MKACKAHFHKYSNDKEERHQLILQADFGVTMIHVINLPKQSFGIYRKNKSITKCFHGTVLFILCSFQPGCNCTSS